MKKEYQEKLDVLRMKMIDWEAGCPKRIQHFLKVSSFAEAIAYGEGADEHTRFLLAALGLIHDIGIRIAYERDGVCVGKTQEMYGEPAAKEMLLDIGFSEEDAQRISMIVGKHHTYDADIEGLDFRILLEADACVNMYEEEPADSVRHAMLRNVFRTETGKRIYRTMFGLDQE